VCVCERERERESVKGDELHSALGHVLSLLDREEPSLCVCVCVCVREREREKERERLC